VVDVEAGAGRVDDEAVVTGVGDVDGGDDPTLLGDGGRHASDDGVVGGGVQADGDRVRGGGGCGHVISLSPPSSVLGRGAATRRSARLPQYPVWARDVDTVA